MAGGGRAACHMDPGKENKLADQEKTPDRKGSDTNDDEAGNREFNQFRYTPYTTDIGFFSDPAIYEAGNVPRAALESHEQHGTRSSPEPRQGSRSDEDIRNEIDRLLSWQGQVDADGIQVQVNDGVVTLSGNVRSQQEMQTVENMIKNVIGVSKVDNHLKPKSGEQ